jgi:anti-sigma factor (TIGR02949 family)
MSSSTSQYSNCRDLFAVLSQYLDAELTPTDCAAIEQHIAGCPPCVEFVNSLKKTVELCRTAGTAPEPPPLSDEVRQWLLEAYEQSMGERA